MKQGPRISFWCHIFQNQTQPFNRLLYRFGVSLLAHTFYFLQLQVCTVWLFQVAKITEDKYVICLLLCFTVLYLKVSTLWAAIDACALILLTRMLISYIFLLCGVKLIYTLIAICCVVLHFCCDCQGKLIEYRNILWDQQTQWIHTKLSNQLWWLYCFI